MILNLCSRINKNILEFEQVYLIENRTLNKNLTENYCGIAHSIGIKKFAELIAERIHSNAGKTENGFKPNN